MELYLVRHGQSEANVGIDVSDPRLTVLGERQAEQLGQSLRNVHFDRIFSSHLLRAVQTAARVRQYQNGVAPVEILPELAECGAGDYVTTAETVHSVCASARIHGVQSRAFDEDAQRAAYCLAQCVFPLAYEGEMPNVTHDGGDIVAQNDLHVLIVSHGMFNAQLIAQLMHFSFNKNVIVSQNNACVNRFHLFCVNGGRRIRLRSLNDVSHLPEEMRT